MEINSLVIFKSKPALVTAVEDKKITINTLDNKIIKLPERNVLFLCGNCHDLDTVIPPEKSELISAWELLQEETTTTIEELSELIFGEFSPSTAYATWLIADEGLYFSFNDNFSIVTHDKITVETTKKEREQKQEKELALSSFLERLKNREYLSKDEPLIKEIVSLANNKTATCRLLKNIKTEETPQNAHKILLEMGYWDDFVNPYIQRFDIKTDKHEYISESMPDIERVDLTHLKCFAIDDADSNDPDDAISWDFENKMLWVHVADPASIVKPNTKIDIEARLRAVNLYLPEGTIPMMPIEITEAFALGLTKTSPALSVSLKVNEDGDVCDYNICLSTIQVERLSYENAEKLLKEENFKEIKSFANNFNKKRKQNSAVELQFPEIKIKASDKNIEITQMAELSSRILVRDSMLMAGVAVANFAQDNDIPMAFSTQEMHEISPENCSPRFPSEMFATRKKLKKGQYKSFADTHSGMGLDAYVQATSPLRRYLDLVAHQQIHAFLQNQPMLTSNEILERIGSIESSVKNARQTENYSNTHWKIAYLKQNPEWTGEAIVIEKSHGGRVMILIPSLNIIKKMMVSQDVELDEKIEVIFSNAKIHNQDIYFKELF